MDCSNCNLQIMTEPFEFQPTFCFCPKMNMNKQICCQECFYFLQGEEEREKFINKQLCGEIDCDGDEIKQEVIVDEELIDLPLVEKYFIEQDEKVKYIVDDIIITDENYRKIQKMISKKYYDKHVDAILTRSLIYYENNREKVLARNKAKYFEKKKDKFQEKYDLANEKHLKSLSECKLCGLEKQARHMYCDSCIKKKFGENIVF